MFKTGRCPGRVIRVVLAARKSLPVYHDEQTFQSRRYFEFGPTADMGTGFLHQQNPNVARIGNGTE
jgi:hypothetical protein